MEILFDDTIFTPTEIQHEANQLIKQGFESVNNAKNVFPTSVLPEVFRNVVTECNKSLNFPEDYTGAAIIAAVSAAIGKSAILKVKNHWFEYGAFYIAIVGGAGANKSHPLDLAFKPFADIDKMAIDEYKRKLNEYIEIENQRKRDKEGKIPLPEKPILKKSILHNFTPEILNQRLADNERGCYVVSEELETFLVGMNNYSKGDQSSVYLSFWSNKPTSIDRVSNPIPLWLPNPFLGIIGSLQPRVIQKLFPKAKTNNGFIQRFLFAFPECAEKQPINDNELPTGLIEQYTQWVKDYRECNPVKIDEDGDPKPVVYHWSDEAKQAFYKWQADNCKKVTEAGDSLESEVITKFDNHFVRLCLILQIMDNYTTNQISLKAVEGAKQLCRYFEQCAFKVLDILESADPSNVLPENKSNWFKSLPETFTTSEAISKGKELGISERTIKNYLKQDTDLFRNVAHGKYIKKQ